jgi:hypothetical protein
VKYGNAAPQAYNPQAPTFHFTGIHAIVTSAASVHNGCPQTKVPADRSQLTPAQKPASPQ